jgi:hypothetical protein
MNTWQILQQVKYLLKSRKWAGSPSNAVVFHPDAIRITGGVNPKAIDALIKPAVLLKSLGAQSDPEYGEEPDLIEQTVNVAIVAMGAGDQFGENAIIGANRQSFTDSRGRGLLEIEPEVFGAIERLNDIDGVRILSRIDGGDQILLDAEERPYALREYSYKVLCTADEYYHDATHLVATGGSGQVSLSWTLPPDRFDRYRVLLRRASGATPPSSVTAGTAVTLAGNLSTSVTDTGLTPGTYSYALFSQYDVTNPTPAQADKTSTGTSIASITVN